MRGFNRVSRPMARLPVSSHVPPLLTPMDSSGEEGGYLHQQQTPLQVAPRLQLQNKSEDERAASPRPGPTDELVRSSSSSGGHGGSSTGNNNTTTVVVNNIITYSTHHQQLLQPGRPAGGSAGAQRGRLYGDQRTFVAGSVQTRRSRRVSVTKINSSGSSSASEQGNENETLLKSIADQIMTEPPAGGPVGFEDTTKFPSSHSRFAAGENVSSGRDGDAAPGVSDTDGPRAARPRPTDDGAADGKNPSNESAATTTASSVRSKSLLRNYDPNLHMKNLYQVNGGLERNANPAQGASLLTAASTCSTTSAGGRGHLLHVRGVNAGAAASKTATNSTSSKNSTGTIVTGSTNAGTTARIVTVPPSGLVGGGAGRSDTPASVSGLPANSVSAVPGRTILPTTWNLKLQSSGSRSHLLQQGLLTAPGSAAAKNSAEQQTVLCTKSNPDARGELQIPDQNSTTAAAVASHTNNAPALRQGGPASAWTRPAGNLTASNAVYATARKKSPTAPGGPLSGQKADQKNGLLKSVLAATDCSLKEQQSGSPGRRNRSTSRSPSRSPQGPQRRELQHSQRPQPFAPYISEEEEMPRVNRSTNTRPPGPTVETAVVCEPKAPAPRVINATTRVCAVPVPVEVVEASPEVGTDGEIGGDGCWDEKAEINACSADLISTGASRPHATSSAILRKQVLDEGTMGDTNIADCVDFHDFDSTNPHPNPPPIALPLDREAEMRMASADDKSWMQKRTLSMGNVSTTTTASTVASRGAFSNAGRRGFATTGGRSATTPSGSSAGVQLPEAFFPRQTQKPRSPSSPFRRVPAETAGFGSTQDSNFHILPEHSASGAAHPHPRQNRRSPTTAYRSPHAGSSLSSALHSHEALAPAPRAHSSSGRAGGLSNSKAVTSLFSQTADHLGRSRSRPASPASPFRRTRDETEHAGGGAAVGTATHVLHHGGNNKSSYAVSSRSKSNAAAQRINHDPYHLPLFADEFIFHQQHQVLAQYQQPQQRGNHLQGHMVMHRREQEEPRVALLRPHVFCRIRPLFLRERKTRSCVKTRSESAAEMLVSGDCHKVISIKDNCNLNFVRDFKFHNVFKENSSQEEVFQAIGEPCFQSWAYNGVSCCLFAHGQTSTGKTYSIVGDIADRSAGPACSTSTGRQGAPRGAKQAGGHAGLLPRILWRFFESFPSLGVSVLEIYREQIHDLLNHRKPVKCYSSSAQTIKRSVVKVPCKDYTQAIKAVEKGNRQRVEAKTALNATSSRGHLIILLEYRGETLCIVDLAGKETEAGITSLREVMEDTQRRKSLRSLRGEQSQPHNYLLQRSYSSGSIGVCSAQQLAEQRTGVENKKLMMQKSASMHKLVKRKLEKHLLDHDQEEDDHLEMTDHDHLLGNYNEDISGHEEGTTPDGDALHGTSDRFTFSPASRSTASAHTTAAFHRADPGNRGHSRGGGVFSTLQSRCRSNASSKMTEIVMARGGSRGTGGYNNSKTDHIFNNALGLSCSNAQTPADHVSFPATATTTPSNRLKKGAFSQKHTPNGKKHLNGTLRASAPSSVSKKGAASGGSTSAMRVREQQEIMIRSGRRNRYTPSGASTSGAIVQHSATTSSTLATSFPHNQLRMLELKFINKSLFHLSETIQSLRKKDTKTCFRNSKLTFLLQDWLSSKQIYLLATISPSELCFEESLATLRFADAVASLPKVESKRHRFGVNTTNSSAESSLREGSSFAETPITVAPRLQKGGGHAGLLLDDKSVRQVERVGENSLLLPTSRSTTGNTTA
ncbi:unnamed protein product [Amoebophrya sp. A120]|nr:unnamed protein product [Amoebophrya sp. A120]|eukprot:GSA120T00006282001.1